MRDQLGSIGSEKRHTFVGTFERYGTKNGYMRQEETILLKDIKEASTGQCTPTHKGSRLAKAETQVGDIEQSHDTSSR